MNNNIILSASESLKIQERFGMSVREIENTLGAWKTIRPTLQFLYEMGGLPDLGMNDLKRVYENYINENFIN